MLLRQQNAGRHESRRVHPRGDARGHLRAQELVAEVFEQRETFEWRGLGEVPDSALRIASATRKFDAERRYSTVYRAVPDNKACECGAVLRGLRRPAECRAFGTACTPEMPLGSCMVSSEGACRAHYTYGRFRTDRMTEVAA